MRRAAKRDKNEPEIVRQLRLLPGVWVSGPLPPGDFGDRLVRRTSWGPGVCIMVEIKRKGQENRYKHQIEMRERGETLVATCIEDVLPVLGLQ